MIKRVNRGKGKGKAGVKACSCGCQCKEGGYNKEGSNHSSTKTPGKSSNGCSCQCGSEGLKTTTRSDAKRKS